MRQVFDKGFYMGGALASAMTVSKGHFPPKDYDSEPNASSPLQRTRRARRYPPPDGTYSFDKLSSVFASGNRTRDDQPSHIRVGPACRATLPRRGSGCARHTCTRWGRPTATAR